MRSFAGCCCSPFSDSLRSSKQMTVDSFLNGDFMDESDEEGSAADVMDLL